MPSITGVVVVVDAGDSQIEVRSKSTLAVTLAVGSNGSGNAQLSSPTHIAVDENFVHIQDTANSRVIQWLLSDLSYYAKVTWASLTVATARNCLAVNRIRMFLGRAATNREVDSFLFTSPYNAGSQYGTAESGVIVGLCVDNDYIYVADSSNNLVRRVSIGGISAPTDFVAVPAGYTVAALAMDGTSLYVACNHATNDTKVLILNKTTMALSASGDLTGKKVCYDITVDDDNLYFTDTGDHSVNWILKDLSGAITSATDLTDPRGVAILSSAYDDLDNTPRAFASSATGGGLATGSVALYPALAAATATGGGMATGSSSTALTPVTATGGGAASAAATLQPSTAGSATGGGVVTAELPSIPSASTIGGGVTTGSLTASGPADMMVVSVDDNDSVALLTDVEAE